MDFTLTFRDSQEEINYGIYSHRIEYNLFKRLLYSMMIGSLSGSIYFLIIANYLYLCLGTFMFVQTLIANYLSQKSVLHLNIVSFVYQLEIQTLLATLITLLDNSLQRGTIMIITTAAFQLSMWYTFIQQSLSIGTKSYLKLIINLYSSTIQVVLSSQIEQLSLVWIGFAFFSMLFAFQVSYFQEYEKRQKYTLHQNAERIKENLINLIDIPILKCQNNEKDIKLEFIESNKCAENLLKITNQESFVKFTREVTQLESKTPTHYTKQISLLNNQPNQQSTLEAILRKFFNRQIFTDSMIQHTFQAYRCRVKHQTHEYQCQLILLHSNEPYVIIYFQRTYEEYIGKMNQKMLILNQLLKRSVKETFSKINDQQMWVSRVLTKQTKLTEGVKRLDQELYQISIFLANCKLLFNSPKIKSYERTEMNLSELIQSIIFHFKYALTQKKVCVKFRQLCKFPQITGNEILVKQALFNVFENAVIFSKDQITIELKEKIDFNVMKEFFVLKIENIINQQAVENNSKHLKLGHAVVNKILKEIGPFAKMSIKTSSNLYTAQICLFKQF